MPKPNMYQSLHTTVIGKQGIPFEVQIRTWEMHEITEYGVAAHWKYKQGAGAGNEKDFEWVRRLLESQQDTDAEDYVNSLKIDMFDDEVFVFTPKGKIVSLPAGSTPIDFAYAIHSGVGNSMVGAKVMGRICNIDTTLKNGDIIEIITSQSSKGPSRDWLNIVKTSEARTKIKGWFKREKRAENIVAGKSMIDAEFKKYGRPYTEAQKNDIITTIGQKFGFMSADDFYNTLGYGGITISKVSLKLKEEFERVVKAPEPEEAREDFGVEDVKISTAPKNIKSNGGIIVDGLEGCLVKFARCCNPLPGDSVIGFITRGHGVSVHKSDCPNVTLGKDNPENADRWVEAHWENETEHIRYSKAHQ